MDFGKMYVTQWRTDEVTMKTGDRNWELVWNDEKLYDRSAGKHWMMPHDTAEKEKVVMVGESIF